MDDRSRFLYRLIFGAFVIAGVVFLSFRYLVFRGAPHFKLLGIGLMIAVTYLVIDYITKSTKNK